jgi:hypothetical protein
MISRINSVISNVQNSGFYELSSVIEGEHNLFSSEISRLEEGNKRLEGSHWD